jgi:hypothetical protein
MAPARYFISYKCSHGHASVSFCCCSTPSKGPKSWATAGGAETRHLPPSRFLEDKMNEILIPTIIYQIYYSTPYTTGP